LNKIKLLEAQCFHNSAVAVMYKQHKYKSKETGGPVC